eukprot:GHVS01051014.1.p1 GENE.GHVS01051014.1~~GHVS01051014.1.p1  ORF type:complete len:190 (+),score=27.41 GHVS01051014.1:99-668(+)
MVYLNGVTEASADGREEIVVGRQQRDEASQKMAAKLLQGWTLLAETCPQCGVVPLMADRKKETHFCAGCGTWTATTPPPAIPANTEDSHRLTFRVEKTIPLHESEGEWVRKAEGEAKEKVVNLASSEPSAAHSWGEQDLRSHVYSLFLRRISLLASSLQHDEVSAASVERDTKTVEHVMQLFKALPVVR